LEQDDSSGEEVRVEALCWGKTGFNSENWGFGICGFCILLIKSVWGFVKTAFALHAEHSEA
jgi:hypothetical protein